MEKPDEDLIVAKATPKAWLLDRNNPDQGCAVFLELDRAIVAWMRTPGRIDALYTKDDFIALINAVSPFGNFTSDKLLGLLKRMK